MVAAAPTPPAEQQAQPGAFSATLPEQSSTEINDACWAFIEAMPHHLPAAIWNDLKPAVYAAICKFLQAAPKATPQAVPAVDEQMREDAERWRSVEAMVSEVHGGDEFMVIELSARAKPMQHLKTLLAGKIVDSGAPNPGAEMFQEIVQIANRYESIRKTPHAKGEPETGNFLPPMDVAVMVDAKLAFNAKREDHKIENRMKPGGKLT